MIIHLPFNQFEGFLSSLFIYLFIYYFSAPYILSQRITPNEGQKELSLFDKKITGK